MSTIYVVRAVPALDVSGAVAGWIRADPFADGSRPTDKVILRDGTTCGQAEALRRIELDRGLLYASEDEAIRAGIERLREADRRGMLERVRARR